MSFWVDPPALVMIGAIIWILSDRYQAPASVVAAISGATIAAFTIGGIGLYLDWFNWVIPGLVNLTGPYVIVDQGLTGLTEATFPAWMAVLFLCLYPFWFTLGYEHAKKHRLDSRLVPPLMVGVVLLALPSEIEYQFILH